MGLDNANYLFHKKKSNSKITQGNLENLKQRFQVSSDLIIYYILFAGTKKVLKVELPCTLFRLSRNITIWASLATQVSTVSNLYNNFKTQDMILLLPLDIDATFKTYSQTAQQLEDSLYINYKQQ